MSDAQVGVLVVRRPWEAGVRAAWANRWPGAALSVLAVGILGAYLLSPAVRGWFEQVSQFKQGTGWWFGVVSTAVAGGVLPWVVQRLRPAQRAEATVAAGVFVALFWGYKGVETEWLYRVQAAVWGEATTPTVVAAKVATDMLLWVPLWAMPMTLAAYQWMNRTLVRRGARGPGDPGPARGGARPGSGGVGAGQPSAGMVGRFAAWYGRDVVPVMVSNWAVWLPAVCVIYVLPTPLQLVMQNIVLCFWSLLLVFQVQRG